ncbi:hypothetical protein FS320_10875 [Microvirga tunisiensis]|uniref:Uncharacterized protein n=1 Tax=Microvirga tunisiensis TaxID=2108360 RepID=A0A5N7MG42_9HYPH|nr:hypothetical protein [Microvirga tunisiensis]MPR25718.1 hypothetical protein [Microvirga tunisiensis]
MATPRCKLGTPIPCDRSSSCPFQKRGRARPIRDAAWTLLEAVRAKRSGELVTAGENKEPRQK